MIRMFLYITDFADELLILLAEVGESFLFVDGALQIRRLHIKLRIFASRRLLLLLLHLFPLQLQKSFDIAINIAEE